jgi:hypothetical protein
MQDACDPGTGGWAEGIGRIGRIVRIGAGGGEARQHLTGKTDGDRIMAGQDHGDPPPPGFLRGEEVKGDLPDLVCPVEQIAV